MKHTHRKSCPRHVAMIMDGNGRWAAKRNLPRYKGHLRGVDSLGEIIKAAMQAQIEGLTLYAFSSDNWKRPVSEVKFLMSLLHRYLTHKVDECIRRSIHLNIIGRRDRLPRGMNAAIQKMEAATQNCHRITVRLAIDYSGRYSLMQASRMGALEYDLNDVVFADLLRKVNHINSKLPEVDFLIRTGGENRLSDFLLWELAYAEFYFTPVLWPDFDAVHFGEALDAFSRRTRRFGALPGESFSGELNISRIRTVSNWNPEQPIISGAGRQI